MSALLGAMPAAWSVSRKPGDKSAPSLREAVASTRQPREAEQCVEPMAAPFDPRAQQVRADRCIGDAVAAIGHRQQHARAEHRMRIEEGQAVRGYGVDA